MFRVFVLCVYHSTGALSSPSDIPSDSGPCPGQHEYQAADVLKVHVLMLDLAVFGPHLYTTRYFPHRTNDFIRS